MKKVYLKDLQPDEVIRRLKAGEVVKNDERKYEKKLIDGIICKIYNDKVYVINDYLISDESVYFEEPEELKLEEGKRYKTKGGYMAFIAEYGGDCYFYGSIKGYCIGFHWRCDGKHDSNSSFDIVAEWSDDDVAKD